MHKFTFPEFAAKMQRGPMEVRAAIRKGVLSGAMKSLVVVQNATRNAPSAAPGHPAPPGGAVNTGAYLRGWAARPTEAGAIVYNKVPYSGIIESGRRTAAQGAGWPPKQAIKRWAQRRLQLDEKEAASAAFAIARAIAKRGLKPRKVLSSSVPKMAKVIRAEIAAAIKAVWSSK